MPKRGKYTRTRDVHQRDLNEEELIWLFQAAGCRVQPVMGQDGCPDLAVDYCGLTFWVEVKNKGGKLSLTQRAWIDHWTGFVAVARVPEDVPRIIDLVAAHYRKAMRNLPRR